jgi:hypothetical protein
MSTGSLTLALLLLAVDAGAPEVWHMNSPKFGIPITINQERKADIRELVLYVSKDKGHSWEPVERKTPDQKEFAYHAPSDGMDFFSVAIVNQRGVQEPADVSKEPIGQKIVVDCTRPVIQLSTGERHGEEVAVKWQIWEDNPDPSTLKLEYRPADNPAAPWTPVPVTPGPTGQGMVRQLGNSPVCVRLSVKDLAGNEGIGKLDIAAPVGPSVPPGTSTAGAAPVLRRRRAARPRSCRRPRRCANRSRAAWGRVGRRPR